MLYFTYRAWAAIKQRDIATHEQFTRYTYAMGLGIVTIRLIAYILLFTAIDDGTVLNISLACGWALTVLAVYYYNHRLQTDARSISS